MVSMLLYTNNASKLYGQYANTWEFWCVENSGKYIRVLSYLYGTYIQSSVGVDINNTKSTTIHISI